jgi:hypothetical protein
MAKIEAFKGYQGEPPVAKPDVAPAANVVTAQDGMPVKYPGCERRYFYSSTAVV